MLQIASGMYFSTTDLHETVHRRTFYTNVMRLRADDICLPIGTLRFSSGVSPVRSIMIEATDRLEKVDANGNDSAHIATGGDELLEDVADVVAFGLDALVVPDLDQARRIITRPTHALGARRQLLRRVFEPARYINDDEIERLRAFCDQVLALQRPQFELVMRAIRRVADAVALSASDVTLAYTLFVAALESLSKGTPVSTLEWSQYEKPKRVLVDAASETLTVEQRDAVRSAVLGIDALSIRRRFQAFVLEHVGPSFYRDEAIGAQFPIRATELPKALDFAYRVRSTSMHDLRDLAPELWRLVDEGEKSWHDGSTVLTLEGLHRLCQHVIRAYVDRAPVGVDLDFQGAYREAIPGIIRVRLAPQYWVAYETDFAAARGPALFSALVEMSSAAARGESNAVGDMTAALERIEHLLRSETKPAARLPLFAVYRLWHLMLAEEYRRPNYEQVIELHDILLAGPSIYGLTLSTLFNGDPEWSDEDVTVLIDERDGQLRRATKTLLELPPRIDAAFQIDLARRAWNRGDAKEAALRVGKAIEHLPGDVELLELEQNLEAGALERVVLRDIAIGPKVEDSSDDEPVELT